MCIRRPGKGRPPGEENHGDGWHEAGIHKNGPGHHDPPGAARDLRSSSLLQRPARHNAGANARRVRPDAVLVQGETTTVLVAALSAFYRGIPVGHVEAGLRTGDMHNPFPEESVLTI
ncbi:UDP-N-acetylglucosamine 2-epimerase [Desulfovibrio sp. ZJ200]|uniref:UDP-N-acetylglucosamine 2-epimerase n=1 Tax=Desulfovibrio sp. ZJ200 TaxID=2709792 RepID=UPI001F14C71E|nr:UDP-N-acetylglucosamine 2-epimerase [Desulfovibrio sp. ZJ200]